MTQKKALVQAGIFGNTAAAILGDVATGVSAAGTTQATATSLTANVNVIGTAAASSGVVVPASEAGDVIEVYNQGANALAVYPPGSEIIDALSASASFAVGAGKAATFRKVSATTWVSLLGA